MGPSNQSQICNLNHLDVDNSLLLKNIQYRSNSVFSSFGPFLSFLIQRIEELWSYQKEKIVEKGKINQIKRAAARIAKTSKKEKRE